MLITWSSLVIGQTPENTKIMFLKMTNMIFSVKFIYFEKATKFCEISTNYSFYVLPVKKLVEISKNLVAFSEYVNFNLVYII